MWTNFDGVHSTTSLVSVCPTKACDQCVLLSLFPEYNVSIDDMLSQWNTFPCHRWGIFGQYMRVSHYGILLDDHAKLELLLQHSHMDQSLSQMVVLTFLCFSMPCITFHCISLPCHT
jgi:hypothetical protein